MLPESPRSRIVLSMLRNLRGIGRGLVVLAVALGWLAVGAFGGMAQGSLSQVQTNDSAAFLPSSAESTRAAELATGFTETESLPVLVVLAGEEGEPLDPGAMAAVQPVVEGLPDVPLPGADPAAGDPATIGDVLAGDPVVVPSEDGEALLVPLSLDAAATEQALADDESVVGAVVQGLRDTLADELGASADTAGEAGLRAWVTGPGGFVADLTNAFGGIDGVLLLVALGAVLVILVLVYRSPFLPLAVILTAVFALCAAALAVYHLADAGALTLNGQAQGILSILVVGASVDYALLIVARYREELRAVESPVAAMRRALRRSIEPIAASAGTVVAGLLCLLLSDLASNRSLGPVGAIGIASAFLAAFTLLPLLLLVAGRRSRALFWPRVPRPELGAHAAGKADGDGADRAGLPASERAATELTPAWVNALAADWRAASDFASVVEDPAALLDGLAGDLVAPLAVAWRADPEGRAAAVDDARAAATERQRGLSVLLNEQFTVISSSAPITVAVRNDLDQAAQVRVELRPHKGCLDTTRSALTTVAPRAETSVTLTLRATANCDVDVDVSLVSASGRELATPAAFSARVAPTIESVGTIVIGALLALALAFGIWRTVRRGQTARRGARVVPDAPAEEDGAGPAGPAPGGGTPS